MSVSQAEPVAATDHLRVIKADAGTCARCYRPFDYNPADTVRRQRYCSKRCKNDARNESRKAARVSRPAPHQPPPEKAHELPPMPDAPRWENAYCSNAPAGVRFYWTSDAEPERQAARFMCLTRCPELQACELWSSFLPLSDASIYAGMSQIERRRRRRAIMDAIAIQAIHGADA